MRAGKTVIDKLKITLEEMREVEGKDSGPYVFKKAVEDKEVILNVLDFDKFSYYLQAVQVRKANDVTESGEGIESLRNKAQSLAERLTYLVENLSVVEADAANLKVQMRSAVPNNDSNSISYFELILDARGSILLNRIQHDRLTRKNTAVPFHLTVEILDRLIDDLCDALN